MSNVLEMRPMIDKLKNLTAKELVEYVLALPDNETFAEINDTIARNYDAFEELVPVKTDGTWIITGDGKRFLDGITAYSAANLGHNNTYVRNVITAFLNQQSPTVLGRFLVSKPLALAGKLLKEMTGYEAFLPSNGGVEAPESAVKLARLIHHNKGLKNPDIICFSGCFHGRSIAFTQLLDDDPSLTGFGPFPKGFTKIKYNNIDAVKTVIGKNTAAVLIEPLQGEGGINIPDPEYLVEVRQLCDETDTLLIYDEIQTGWGRTGKLFAWEHAGARPDILCIGKSLSAGFVPVSGILADKEWMNAFTPGSHGSTFGGSPLSMITVIASLTEFHRLDLSKKSAVMGEYALSKLKELAQKSSSIKEVRGLGLMIGIEVAPGEKSGCDFSNELIKNGLIVKETHERVIRFSPPLICTKKEIDFAIKCFEKVFL